MPSLGKTLLTFALGVGGWGGGEGHGVGTLQAEDAAVQSRRGEKEQEVHWRSKVV